MLRLLLLVLLAAAGAVLAACGSGGGPGTAARTRRPPRHRRGREPAARARRPPPGRAAPDPAADPVVHVRALARIAREHGGTRAAGTPGARASEDYVAARLAAAGYTVRRQAVPSPSSTSAGRRGCRRKGPRARAHDGLLAGRPGPPAASSRWGSAAPRALRRPAAGAVALARRGICPFRQKARLAQAAGAAAVLVADRGAEPVSATLGAPGLRIPALAVGAPGRAP